MITSDRLIQLLGKSITAPEVERLNSELGDPEIVEFDGNFDYCFYQHGIALIFEDGILGTLQLFPEGRDGYKQYSYPIPNGLRFPSKQAEVRKALGKPTESSGDKVEESDVYKLKDYVLTISYVAKTKITNLFTFMTFETFSEFE